MVMDLIGNKQITGIGEEDEVLKRTKGVALKRYWVSNHSLEDSPVVSINPVEY